MANISIIVATKNCFEKIDALMLSLFRQDERDIEIICVDDASSDTTLNLLTHYAEFDKRIQIIANKKSVGLLECCRIGLKKATAPYVMFLNGTHHLLLVQAFLERLLNSAKQYNSDIVYTPSVFVDAETFAAYPLYIFSPQMFHSVVQKPCFAGKALHPQLLFMLYLSPYGKLYKTEFIKKMDFSAYDEPFFLDAMLKAERISYDLYFLCYRQVRRAEMERPQIFDEQRENQTVLQQNGVWNSHKHAFICYKMGTAQLVMQNAPQAQRPEIFAKMQKEFSAENFAQYDFNVLRKYKIYWMFQKIADMSYEDFVASTTSVAQ
ncbi:MAG: glycosyltransferase family 2 protein [Alphaproteobacteria bacterium]|nr:glycosyltransferase family 2 protein [Alphaproteobacteria bacterium]